jgi:hypothetical protein
MKKQPKKSWIVTMRCEVQKRVVTDECTYEEAEQNPWDHAEEETEVQQHDWEVQRVEPND